MRCREAELWISSRIDGEAIPHGALEALETHLAACAGCSRLLHDEEERARALGAYLAAGDAEPLARAVMARVRAGEADSVPEPRLPARGAAPFGRPIAVAAAALLAVGMLVVLRPGPHLADRPGSKAAEGPAPRLIYVHEEMAPFAGGSPLEKQVFERRQVIVEPIQDGRSGDSPPGSDPRQYMQYQKFTDYRYY